MRMVMVKKTATLARMILRTVPAKGGKVIVMGAERGMVSSFHHSCGVWTDGCGRIPTHDDETVMNGAPSSFGRETRVIWMARVGGRRGSGWRRGRRLRCDGRRRRRCGRRR